jgi:hypothetical protein
LAPQASHIAAFEPVSAPATFRLWMLPSCEIQPEKILPCDWMLI